MRLLLASAIMLVTLALFGPLAAVATAQVPVLVKIDPRGTYLHTYSDAAPAAAAIPLATLGLAPGDSVRLSCQGDWDNGPGADIYTGTLGVFSSSATVLATSQLHRLPGAIDAGTDMVSPVTNIGQQATDIPEDFEIARNSGGNGVRVLVPVGAVYLFVCAWDSYYTDNGDPDQDYHLVSERLQGPVPAEERSWGGVKSLYR